MKIYKCSQCDTIIKIAPKDDISTCKKCTSSLIEYSPTEEFSINPDGVLASYNGDATSVRVPDGVTAIGWNAFRGCSTLSSVIIPEGVTRIEGRAFASCENLESLSIPNTVSYIGNGVFFKCKDRIYGGGCK